MTCLCNARAASEREAEPSRVPTLINAPERSPRAVPTVPGVGRVASREELIRMGVIPVPLEAGALPYPADENDDKRACD
jgi:hypothetical protein